MRQLRSRLAIVLVWFVVALGASSAEASISRDLSNRSRLGALTSADSFAVAPTLSSPSLAEELSAIEAKASKAADCVALCDLAATVEAHPFGVASAESPNRSEDAWGNYRFTSELAPSKNRFGFTGHYWDNEAGLYYAKARYYDPFTARFTQSDSFLGSIDDPPSLHRYLYANANPTAYVDEDGHSATAIGTAAGFMWGFGQMIGAGIDDLVTGRQRSTGAYLSVWAQNTIGGAQLGASVDVGLLSGGLAMSASGALGNAGLSALTVGGEGEGWGDFGREQVTQGGVGAALGPVVAKAVPFVRKALSMIPGAKAAGAWVAGKVSQLAGGVAERFTVAESDAWITRSAGEQISALGGKSTMPRPADPYSPNWSQYYTDNPNAMRFGPGAMRQGELGVAPRSGPLEVDGFKLAKHGDMPRPRPTGTESHHGAMSRWMKEHFPGYNPDKAPAVLMPGEAHDATRGMYNTWRAQMKREMGGKFEWNKVAEPDIRGLGDRMFDASKTPAPIQGGYWNWFERMKAALSRRAPGE